MPLRLGLRPQCLHKAIQSQTRLASLTTAVPTPTATAHPPTQPPSHKRPEYRKSQLIRQYQSLLRSSPCILLFQHNNLRVPEWTAVRRELTRALRHVDQAASDQTGEYTRMTVIQTALLAAALRVVEFGSSEEPGLSRKAWRVSRDKRRLVHGFEPLLSGPLMLVSFPALSPPHVGAVLSRLAPSVGFPAPKRRANPEFHDPAVQNGVQKLMLLGARIEGRVFDADGVSLVAGIQGGLDGLRAQLVDMLCRAGGGALSNALRAQSTSLYLTLEGRRTMLEQDQDEQA